MMKKIASTIIILTMLLTSAGAQVKTYPVVHHEDIDLDVGETDFGDQLAVKVVSDANWDYYAIDLVKFDNEFQRAYFLNLIYKEKIVISIDSDLGKDHLWVKSSQIFDDNEVVCLLDELREESIDADESFSTNEKESWLKKHIKLTEK